MHICTYFAYEWNGNLRVASHVRAVIVGNRYEGDARWSTKAFNQIDDMHGNKDLKIYSKDSNAIWFNPRRALSF